LLRDEIVHGNPARSGLEGHSENCAMEKDARLRDESRRKTTLQDAKMAALYREVVLKEKPGFEGVDSFR